LLYELRVYHCVAGRLPDLHARFERFTLRIWERHGIRPVGFWTVVIGNGSNDLYYMLEWKDLGEREAKWNAFLTDPGWLAVRSETENKGPLFHSVTNTILAPTAYSPMK
jgi:NIPSNAP protein